jgi:hypothetical protein
MVIGVNNVITHNMDNHYVNMCHNVLCISLEFE